MRTDDDDRLAPTNRHMGRGRGIPRRQGAAGGRLGVLLGVLLLLSASITVGAASLRAAGGQGSDNDLLAAASFMATAAPGQYGVIADGEIVSLGHNQHASGLRIHHPKVKLR